MFNYVGEIVRKQPYNIATGNLDIYDVKVAQFSDKEIPARVLAPAGLSVSYSQGDLVVVAELEPDKYLILGTLQKGGDDTSSYKLGKVSAVSLFADGGLLSSQVRLSDGIKNKSIQELFDMLNNIQEQLAEIHQSILLYGTFLPPVSNNV